MKNKTLLIAAVWLGVLLMSQVYAQNTFRDWEGVDSNDWMTPTNWQDDTIPEGESATARIYNSTTGSDPVVPYNTVLREDDSANLRNVWIGNAGDATKSGNLTVEANASLTTTENFIIRNNSKLTSSGAISVGNVNGLIVSDSAEVILKNGSTLNRLNLSSDSTATLESGSSVTEILNPRDNVQLTMNNSYSRNLIMAGKSILTLNGTINGNFSTDSTEMQYIGATGTVNGNVQLGGNDQITIAGTVQGGTFSLNGTGTAVIESTANILSDGEQSWLYADASVTWNVGANGEIGTLRTNRGGTSTDDGEENFDGEWRYTGTTQSGETVSLLVVLDDYEIDGETIALQLVSDIQNENVFAEEVSFMWKGKDVTDDWTWIGNGTFNGIVIPEPSTYALLTGCLALIAVMLCRHRA